MSMLEKSDLEALKKGQGMFLEVPFRGSKEPAIVQVVPIRSGRTGRVKRFHVTIAKHGRGTVAR